MFINASSINVSTKPEKKQKRIQTRDKNLSVFRPKSRKRLNIHKISQGSNFHVYNWQIRSFSKKTLQRLHRLRSQSKSVLPPLSRFEIVYIKYLQSHLKHFQKKGIYSVNSNFFYCSIERKEF